jgi:CubicO group peptidase (beta-lactamase class C family)
MRKKVFTAALMLILIFIQPVGLTAHAAGGAAEETDAAFFDGLFKENMKKFNVPGLAFAMVKGGEVVYKNGYGMASIEGNIPVDPDATVFRVGSISKLFTAAAVMRLYEQGRLNLDDDVNKYLDSFKITGKSGKKIMVENLLTHTAGFDERNMGLAAKDRESVLPLEKYLSEYRARVFAEPGTVYSYSNYGMTLAGYIVERVSGAPFSDYIGQNILEPLGMKHSSFDPLSGAVENMAQGYTYANGVQNPVPPDYFNAVPAGGLYSTASDMANFMTAVLQDGIFKENRILKKETVELMEKRQFTYNTEMAGIAYGFHERFAGDLRMLEHTGGWPGFTSLLLIIPDRNAGFFFSYNSGTGNDPGMMNDVANSIIDRYYPEARDENVRTESSGTEAAALHSGTYKPLGGFSLYNVEKIMSLLSQVTITADRENHLVLSSALSGGSGGIRWSGSGAGLFECEEEAYKDYKMAFSDDGRYMYIGLSTYEKLPWYEAAGFQLIVLGAFALVFLAGLLLWPARSIVRRLRKKAPLKSKLPEALTGAICILDLLFILSFGVAMAVFQNDLLHGITSGLAIVLSIPFLATLLALIQAVFVIGGRNRGLFAGAARAYYLFFAVCHLAFVPFLNYWNLIGFKF